MGHGAQGLTVPDAGRAAEGRPLLQTILERSQPYLLLVPAVALVCAITLYPIFNLFWIAFHATSYFQVGAWNGVANFLPLFGASGTRSFLASLVFVVASDVITVTLALFLALVMEAPLRGRGLLRTLIMVPWLVSQVVTALLWQALLDPNFGPITQAAMATFGWSFEPLGDERGAMAAMVAANVWRSYPFAVVLILAAVQAIPSELYEAARMDGASRWAELRHITLPMAGRTVMVVLILLTFEYFTLVTLPFILTSGGPNEATYVLSLRVWREAFTNYHFGFSAATGVVVFLLNLALSALYIRHFVLREGGRVSR